MFARAVNLSTSTIDVLHWDELPSFVDVFTTIFTCLCDLPQHWDQSLHQGLQYKKYKSIECHLNCFSITECSKIISPEGSRCVSLFPQQTRNLTSWLFVQGGLKIVRGTWLSGCLQEIPSRDWDMVQMDPMTSNSTNSSREWIGIG